MSKKHSIDTVSDVVAYAAIVAGIFIVTREDRAAKEISAFGNAFANGIRAAIEEPLHDPLDAQLELFTHKFMHDPDSLPELEAELDRELGLVREREHRSWFDQQLGHTRVRSRKVDYD